ncbi:rho-related GTP-binding protein RhoN-like, partial [Petromyzon marinus]|uniref:rho-related GTP-binding protein RhoN-like n=1 Tax=Petromyzon marinus TaxID=7757 RepID=UPI003F6E79E1
RRRVWEQRLGVEAGEGCRLDEERRRVAGRRSWKKKKKEEERLGGSAAGRVRPGEEAGSRSWEAERPRGGGGVGEAGRCSWEGGTTKKRTCATPHLGSRTYIPTVFENYTASFEIEKQRIELNMWDTSGAPYYDNVRPLAYPDSDVVLICYDVARPETLDSVLKKWRVESHEFGASTKVLLIGCKADLRADLQTLLELSKQRCIPVTQEQGAAVARQLGAAAYVECSAKLSEDSVRDVFHMATLAALGRLPRYLVRRSHSRRETASATRTPPSSPSAAAAAAASAASAASSAVASSSSAASSAEGQRAARHPRRERAKSCAVM